MSSSGGNKQTTAVADAIAGVVGSVISTIVFYPVDVWKTSRQTSTTSASTADSYNEGEGGGCAATTAETKIPTTGIVKHDNDDNINRRLLLLLRWRDNLLSFLKLQRQSYYRGLSYKIIHIVASSFVYNYIHSLLSSEYISYCHRQRQRQRQRRQCHGRRSRRSFNETAMTEKQQQQLRLDEGDSNDDDNYYSLHEDEKTITKMSVGIKLVLTAIAAMINSCITLPLDTISSRKQVETIVTNKQMQHQQQQQQQQTQQCTTSSPSSSNNNEVALSSSFLSSSSSSLSSALSLWSGLMPALILCTNPAINYTVYEVLKGLALSSSSSSSIITTTTMSDTATIATRRSSRYISNTEQYTSSSSSSMLPQPTQSQQSKTKLSMQQSFIFGLLSKFIATVLTYPLVRCKVLLMVNNNGTITTHPSSSCSSLLMSPSSSSSSLPSSKTTTPTTSPASRTSSIRYLIQLLQLLQYIYKYDGGIYGLYRGCDIQLLHVLLKGALMMMIRERIQQSIKW